MSDAIFKDGSVSELKYEQAYEKLEQIVERMNDASVPLDELISLYEQGMALGAHCEALLSGYEARMEMVSKNALSAELAKLRADEAASGEDEE